jgi:hypothetical protein
MTRWHNLSNAEKLTIIRDGYIDGKSASDIAREQGTTRNAVLGQAYRWGLKKPAAFQWSQEYGNEFRANLLKHEAELRSIDRVHKERSPIRRNFSEDFLRGLRAKYRANLQNKAEDDLTRKAVSMINSIKTMNDNMIAEALGFGRERIYLWRSGRAKISDFGYQCVLDFMERVND